jgi:hypothetical protein
MGDITNACKYLVGKAGRNNPIGKPRHRWEYINIKMCLKEGARGSLVG